MLLWCTSKYTHERIWFIMYWLCIWQARVHANETREMCHVCSCEPKRTSAICANKNVRVYSVQTKDACTLFVQTMMHTTAHYCLVYTCEYLKYIFMSLLFRAHAARIFRNMSNCVVASRVCSQV